VLKRGGYHIELQPKGSRPQGGTMKIYEGFLIKTDKENWGYLSSEIVDKALNTKVYDICKF